MEFERKYDAFEDDRDYLEAEYRWLQARVHRMSLEQVLDVIAPADGPWNEKVVGDVLPVTDQETLRRVEKTREVEAALRDEIDGRLTQTRQEYGCKHLAAARLSYEYKLDGDERLILMIACLPSISGAYMREILGDFCSYQSLTVEDLITVAINPHTVEEWLRGRHYFEMDSSKLIKHGLISLEFNSKQHTPESLLHADVHLSMQTFYDLIGRD